VRSNKVRLFVGLLISVVFLYLAFRKVDFGRMWEAIRQANYWYLVPCALVMFGSLWMRSYRWGIFFRPIRPMRMKNLFAALMVGYMANNIFPFKLGEVVRAYSIGELEGFSKVASFATVVVERILDVISLIILLGIVLLFQPFPDFIKTSGLILFLFAIAAILFLAFLVVKTEQTISFYRKVTGFLPGKLSEKGEKILESLLEGFVILRSPRYYLATLISSVLIWVFYVLFVHFVILAFGFDRMYGVPLLASATVLVMTGISVSVPSSPGYVGTYHYLVMQGLILYGVPDSEALSFAVVQHILTMLPTTLLGLYYFTRHHLSLKPVIEEAVEP
jgi:hypothetical protein